ncbi:MAG: phosphodiester glycosidase family protein [Bacteroidota bacterium]
MKRFWGYGITGLILLVLLGVGWVMAYPISSLVVDPARYRIEVHWKDRNGNLLGDLGRLQEFVEKSNSAQGRRKMVLGMNAGMYLGTPLGHPMGLLVVNGRHGCCKASSHGKLILKQGASRNSNFYLQPNGVFYITKSGKAGVCKSAESTRLRDIQFATQSGPLLVVNGQINRAKAFSTTSSSKTIRNGVGIRKDGRVVMAISNRPVNFHEFALYMQQQGCINALYLDGGISAMHCPRLGRYGKGHNLGPLMAVVED